jgi:hypothetical protein
MRTWENPAKILKREQQIAWETSCMDFGESWARRSLKRVLCYPVKGIVFRKFDIWLGSDSQGWWRESKIIISQVVD